MALSAKTLKVLKEAGLEPGAVAGFSDEDLLGVPGIGPAVLADIRVMYPAPVAPAVLRPAPAEVLAGADTALDLAAAAERVGVSKPAPDPAALPPAALPPAAPPPAPAAPAATVAPGCTCDQPFRVTRTRQRAGRTERYCDACGAVMGASPERA